MVEELIQEDTLQDPPSKKKLLYDAVSKNYNLGTYDEFEKKLSDPIKRKSLYETVGKEYNLGTYEDFESKLDIKKKELTPSTSLGGQLPVQSNEAEPKIYDPFSEIDRAKELASKTIQSENTGGAGAMGGAGYTQTVSDPVAIEESKRVYEGMGKEGYKEDFIKGVTDLPAAALLHPTTSKEKLIEVYKANPIRFKQLTNEAKIKYAIKDAAFKNANDILPDDENKSYIADQTAIIEGNKFSGDNAPPVENMQDWYNVIKGKQQVIDENITDVDKKNKLRELLKQTYAASINPETPTFKEDYEQSPLKGELDINQYAGLKTLELFEPEKYKQYVLILNNKIDPKYIIPIQVTRDDVELGITSDSALAMKAGGKLADVTVNERIGKESVMRELNYLGLKNTAEQIASEQHDLIKQYKSTDDEIAKNEIAFKLGQTDLKLEELNKSEKQDDERYPLTAQLKFDNQTKEITQDRGVNGLSWMYNKYAHSMGTPVDAVENLVTTMFGSDADKAKLSRKRMGEAQTFEAETYLPESERRTNTPYILKASKPLQDKVNKILNGRSLSSLDETERAQLNEVVKNNQDQIETITQEGGSKNFLSKATLMTMAGFTSDIGAFMTQMGLLKGVGLGAKLAEASTLFSTTYGEDFNHQIAEGKSVSDANSHALLHGGIMALMVKFGSKFEAVQSMLKGGKSALSKEIAGMTEATWNEIYNKNKSLISRLGGAAKDVAKENAKMIGTFGVVAPVATDIADNVFYNKGKAATDIVTDAVESAKEMAIGSMGFMAAGLARGAVKYKANPLEKSAMWDLGDNPEIGKAKIEDAVTKGDLTAQEGEIRKKTIDEVSKLIKKVPTENDKGKLLTDRERIDYLFNLVVKDKATEAAKDLPEKQAEVHEIEKLAAEQKNALLLNPKTPKQLLAQKEKAEKSLIPEKDAEGKNIEIPEKEVLAAKAEIKAIEEVLADAPKEPSFEDKYRKEYPTFKELSNEDINSSAKENATDDPVQFIEKFGEDKFNEIVKDTPIKDLQDKLDTLLKGNPDNKGVDILDKIIAEREALEPPKEPELTTEQKVKELETERDSEVLKLSKPEITSLKGLSDTEISKFKDAKDSERAIEILKEGGERDLLKQLIDCLWG